MSDQLKPWKTLAENVIFAVRPYLEVVQQTVSLPDGGLIEDFYQVHLRNFVIVVPILENGDVMTLRQYKHGPGRVTLTFPAGFVETGEDPEAACRRELLEETGCEAGLLTHMGEFVDNGNQRGCIGNYYVAQNCVKVAEPDSGDLEDMLIERHSSRAIDQAFLDGEFAIIPSRQCVVHGAPQGLDRTLIHCHF